MLMEESMPRSVQIGENPWLKNLELARVLFCPALNNNFLVGIELDRVAALAVQIAEEAVLPSAEGEIRHGRGNANVDADIARGRFVAEAASRRSAGREQ